MSLKHGNLGKSLTIKLDTCKLTRSKVHEFEHGFLLDINGKTIECAAESEEELSDWLATFQKYGMNVPSQTTPTLSGTSGNSTNSPSSSGACTDAPGQPTVVAPVVTHVSTRQFYSENFTEFFRTQRRVSG